MNKKWFENLTNCAQRDLFSAWLVLTMLAMTLCARVLFSSDQIFGTSGTDIAQQFIAWRHFGFMELGGGQLPLWNPHIFAGAPYFGGFQAGMAYPLNWLVFLWLDTRSAINLSVTLHCALMGIFTYHWLRFTKLSEKASLMGGALTMMAGTYVAHIYAGHLPNLCAMVWFPLMLRSVDGISFHENSSGNVMRSSMPSVVLGAVAIAMQILAGHPQYVMVSAVALGVYSLVRVWGGSHFLHSLSALMAMGVLGGAVAAVQLLPGFLGSAESIRSRGVAESFAAMFSLPPENIWTLVVPHALGSLTPGPYFGRWYFWEVCLYMGWVTLLLSLLGAGSGVYVARVQQEIADRARAQQRALAAMCLVALLIALGNATPLHHFLYAAIPGFDRIRGLSKFAFVIAPAFAYWAAQGYDRLDSVAARRLAWCSAGFAAVTCLVALALGGGLGSELLQWLASSRESYFLEEARRQMNAEPFRFLLNQFAQQSSRAFFEGGVELLVWTGLLILIGRRPALKPLLAGGAVLSALFWSNGLIVSTSFEDQIASWTPPADMAKAEYRVANQANKNSGMYTGAMDVSGNDPGVTTRYAELMAVLEGKAPDEASQYIDVTRPHPLHVLLRLQYVKPITPSRADEWLQVLDPPMPRFSLIDGFSVRHSRDAVLQRMMEPSFDPRKEVVLEQAPVPVPERGAQGRVVVQKCASDTCNIEVWVDRPALLLITDAWTPSWRIKSRDSDQSADIAQTYYALLPGDHAFRVVPLAAGKHRLTMYYSRFALYAGAAISGVTILFLLALMAWCFWPQAPRRTLEGDIP